MTLKDMMNAILVSSKEQLNFYEEGGEKLSLKIFDVKFIGYVENSTTYRFLVI